MPKRSGIALYRRCGFARGENTPRRQAGLGDHDTPRFGDRHEMSEHAGMAPGERTRRRADGAIFVGVMRLHQDRADAVRTKVRRQFAVGQPFAFEIPAEARSSQIDRAAAARCAMDAGRPGCFLEFLNFERGATHRAIAARFAMSRRHGVLGKLSAANRRGSVDASLTSFLTGQEYSRPDPAASHFLPTLDASRAFNDCAAMA